MKIYFLLLLSLNSVLAIFGQELEIQEVDYKSDQTSLTRESIQLRETYIGQVERIIDSTILKRFTSKTSTKTKSPFSKKNLGNIGEGVSFIPVSESHTFEYPKPHNISGVTQIKGAHFPIKSLTVENGLPSNNVSASYYSSELISWFGYASGEISKIEGNNITVFNAKQFAPKTPIVKIVEFQGSIIALTFGEGFFVLQGNKMIRYGTEQGFVSDHLHDCAFDSKGNLWITTYNAGLVKLTKNGFYHYPPSERMPAITNLIYFDKGLNSIVFTDYENHVFSIDKSKNIYQWNLPQEILGNEIVAISYRENPIILFEKNYILEKKGTDWIIETIPYESTNANMFVSNSNSLWISSATGDVFIKQRGYWSKIGASNGMIPSRSRGIFQDDFKNIWLSTSIGTSIVSISNFRTLTTTTENLISTNSKIFEGKNNASLVTTQNGFFEFDSDKKITSFIHPKLNGANGLVQLHNSYYITKYGGFFRVSNDSLFQIVGDPDLDIGFYSFLNVAEGNNNKLVLSNYNYALLEYDPLKLELIKFNGFKNLELVSNVFKDSKGNYWISSPLGGVTYVNPQDTQINFEANVGKINDIVEAEDGNHYIAATTGLYRVNLKDQKLHLIDFTGYEEFINIQSLVYSSFDSSLWIGCTKDLIQVQLNKNRFRTYSQDLGYTGVSFGTNSAINIDGNLFWTTEQSLIQHIPFDLSKLINPPTVFIQSYQLDKIEFDLYDNIEGVSFSHIKNGIPQELEISNAYKVFTLELGTDQINSSKSVQFYYREQLDEGYTNWRGPANNNSISFDLKTKNNFRLEIQALINNEKWTDSTYFEFDVTKPYYEKTSFIVILIIFTLVLIGFFIIRSQGLKIGSSRTYSDHASFLNRTRFLGYALVLILPLADYFLVTKFMAIPSEWPMVLSLMMFGATYVAMTYVFKNNRTILTIALLLTISVLSILILLRTLNTNFNPICTVELMVVIAFSSILIEKMKFFLYYFGSIIILLLYSLTLLNFENESHLVYVLGISLTAFFAFTYHYFQIYKVSNVDYASELMTKNKNYAVVIDKHHNVLYLNDFTKSIFRVEDDKIAGSKWYDFLPLDKAYFELMKKNIVTAFSSKNPPEKHKQFFKSTARYIEWNYQFIDNHALLCLGNDITDVQDKEKTLSTLYSALTLIKSGVVLCQADGKIEWANQFFEDIFQIPSETMIGKRPSEIFPIPDFYTEEYQEIILNGIPENTPTEIPHVKPDGSIVWLLIVSTKLRNDKGNVTKIIELVSDITSRKSDEDELKKLSIISEATQSPIFLCDPNLTIEWCNPALLNEFGYSLNEVIGSKPGQLFVGDETEKEHLKIVNDKTSESKSFNLQIYLRSKDNYHAWYKLFVDPIFDKTGKKIHFVCIMQPIGGLIQIQQELQEKNTYITDGIKYAEKIQDSQLSHREILNKHVPDNFVFYKPKDIVSGDFYYFQKVEDKLIIVAADCTGHGVPGAMMTFVGTAAFNNAVNEKGITSPGLILDSVDEYLKNTLSSNKDDITDGMDAIVISIDLDKQEIHYAGARRPLLKLNKSTKDLEILKTDIFSLGEFHDENEHFSTYQLQLEDDFDLYLFSDGITDQFGKTDDSNKKPKKYSMTRLSQFLIESKSNTKKDLLKELENEMKTWTKDFEIEQTDDMVFIGLQFSKNYFV